MHLLSALQSVNPCTCALHFQKRYKALRMGCRQGVMAAAGVNNKALRLDGRRQETAPFSESLDLVLEWLAGWSCGESSSGQQCGWVHTQGHGACLWWLLRELEPWCHPSLHSHRSCFTSHTVVYHRLFTCRRQAKHHS